MVVMVVVLYYSRHFISWLTWTKKYLISTEGLTWLQFLSVIVWANRLSRGFDKQRELIARQTWNTTETWIAYGNSTWHVRKYKVHKLHQRYVLTSSVCWCLEVLQEIAYHLTLPVTYTLNLYKLWPHTIISRSSEALPTRKNRSSRLFATWLGSVQFSSVPWPIWVVGGHDRRFSRVRLPVFFAGSPGKQFWNDQGYPLLNAVHSTFPLSPIHEGAIKDGNTVLDSVYAWTILVVGTSPIRQSANFIRHESYFTDPQTIKLHYCSC